MRDDINPNKFQVMLREEWKTVLQRLAQETKSLSTYPDSNPDILDDSVKMMTQDHRIEMIYYLQSKQNQIEEALKKIENGTYGICSHCGEDIELERLEVKPYAQFCMRCKTELERKKD